MTTEALPLRRSRAARELPSLFRRVEGLAVLAAALALYSAQGFGWATFALLLLAPDLAALGYLVGKRVGDISYNLAHMLTFPLLLAVLAGLNGQELGLQLGLIWLAHIGMDRTVGYDLKGGAGDGVPPSRR